MNRYEKGFLTKCAEYGIDGRDLLEKRSSLASLLISPFSHPVLSTATGALLGGYLGQQIGVDKEEKDDKKKRIKNAIIGAILGAGSGYSLNDARMQLYNSLLNK